MEGQSKNSSFQILSNNNSRSRSKDLQNKHTCVYTNKTSLELLSKKLYIQNLKQKWNNILPVHTVRILNVL